MKSTRRLLKGLSLYMDAPISWAADTYLWLCRAVEWADEEIVFLPSVDGPFRVTMDAPGRRARHIQIYEGKLLLATLEREPAAEKCENHSLDSTIKKARIEWRCRVAGEKRKLAELLMMQLCLYTYIRASHGALNITYASDPDRPIETAQCSTWPGKTAAVMTRIARAYASQQKMVQRAPAVYCLGWDIAPTVLLSFEQ